MSVLVTMGTVKGAVFAADRPGVILPFPDGLPGGIAVGGKDIESVDKWLPVVRDFLGAGLFQSRDSFEAYVDAFEDFIANQALMSSGMEVEVVLQGYGEKEMFPSAARLQLGKGTDALCPAVLVTQSFHPYESRSSVHVLGNNGDIRTLVRGISSENETRYVEEFTRQVRNMKKRLVSVAEQSGNPGVVKEVKRVRIGDYTDRFKDLLQKMVSDHFLMPFDIAIESFNLDDLIGSSERLVDLAGLLEHFRNGEADCASTREIAIITRAEGFVWIKRA